MAAKLILLCLDAFEPTLLERWSAEGKLPVITRMRENGASGPVRGLEGLYVGSSWTTFCTGLSPAGHGFYRPSQIVPGEYANFRPLDVPDGFAGTPVWTLASEAGRRVCVVDAPLCPLEQNMNGVHVVEWSGEGHVAFSTTPPGLATEILERYGEYPALHYDSPLPTRDDLERMLREFELGVEKKLQLTLDLLGRDDWDLFFSVFLECHGVGQQFWHQHDPSHPSHDADWAALRGDPIERVYRALDEAIGTILERAGDAHVLLFAIHGMRAHYGQGILFREILFRLGATVPRSEPPVPRLHELLYRLRVTNNAVYRKARAKLASTARSSDDSIFQRADLGASRCFPIVNGYNVGAIRLNLAGREPQGILQPGSEADAFCDQLADDLLEIVHEPTGQPLVSSVDRVDRLWHGPRLDALPDLLVQWNPALVTGSTVHANGRGATVRAQSEKIGLVEGRSHYHRTGSHTARGFFAHVGPGVSATTRTEPVEVVDFYPTLCELLDIPVPAVDGAVIGELVVAT